MSRNLFSQIPNIGLDNPQNWGAYVIQNNYDHEVDIFNFTVGGYSGSFYLDQNFQPVILTKDNNCKVEVVGTFNQNYEFKVTTNDGIVYNFGGTGFTEKTFNKDDSSSAGVTSFYLKTITDIRNNVINFQYEDVGVLRSIITDIQENFNTQADVVMEPACGGHPLPSSSIEVKNNFLKISDPKRIKKVIFEDKSISFNYSSDYVFYNKLDNIQVAVNSNVIKKYSFDYLDKFNTNNQLQRFFLTNIKFYENPTVNSVPVNEYILEYDNPSELPERLSKSIDYLGYYNGTFNGLNTLLPNLNLFNDTNIPAFDNFADRRPLFELAKYGSLKSITYPTKGKTIFEYEPIREAPRNEEFWMNGINPQHQTDTKYALPYELFDGAVQYTFGLYSLDQNVNTPALKARAIFRVYDEQNNLVHASEQITISKATIGLSRSVDGQFTLDRTKKYRFTLEVQDNLCSNCEGYVHMDVKKLSTEHGPGIRLKKQYDISENDTVNVKRIYYTNFSNIPIRYKENNIFVPGFTNSFLLQTASPNPETSTGCDTSTISYPGASTLVRNIKSTPNLSSLEQFYGDTDEKYFNLNDPMYSNITLSFGGDNFENGGEEKEYYIKLRNDIDRKLFAPSFTALGGDQTFVGSASNLSELIQSAKERFHRSFSFSNVDGKLLSDKVFKVENDNIKYIRTSENKYIFNEDTKLYNILGADIYPASTGDPYGLKNKYIASLPVSVDEVFLDETTSTDIPDSAFPDKKIVQNVKNYYNNPDKQLTKQTTTLSDGAITETSYKYASEKNNQLMIDKNMIGIPLETTTTQTIGTVTKTLDKSETIYPTSLPTIQAGNLLLPLSSTSYDVLNNTPSTDVMYDKYDDKGNLLQYTTKDGVPVTIIWGYNKTQPIAKIEGAAYISISDAYLDVNIISASNNDALDPTTEGLLLIALNNFRKESALEGKKITTYTYDPLIGVTSITPPHRE